MPLTPSSRHPVFVRTAPLTLAAHLMHRWDFQARISTTHAQAEWVMAGCGRSSVASSSMPSSTCCRWMVYVVDGRDVLSMAVCIIDGRNRGLRRVCVVIEGRSLCRMRRMTHPHPCGKGRVGCGWQPFCACGGSTFGPTSLKGVEGP